MAIIYTYPVKATPLAADLLLISDSADGNKSKNATIASLVTSNAIDVVDTVTASGAGITASPNKGDVVIANTGVTSLVAGSNIDISGSTGAVTISTSASNVDGSGTAGKIPKWSDSNTLTDSVITDQGGGDIIIPRFIKHEGNLENAFGFFQNGQFLVSVGPSTADQFSVMANAIIMKTDSGTKLAAGPTGVTLYSDENGSTTVSKESLLTYDSGIIVKGGTENSFARGGAVRFYNSTNSGFVGIKGPTTMPTNSNYEIILPNTVGTASQVLKLPSTIGSTPYQLAWGDTASAGGSTGSVQFKNSSSEFAGDTGFTFTNTGGVPKLTIGNTGSDVGGIIEIQSDDNGAELKIGGGSQTYYTSIKGSDSDTASYGIILPPAGPGGNNKILESTSAGILSWIDTPSGSGTTYTAGTNIAISGTNVISSTTTLASTAVVGGFKLLSNTNGTDPTVIYTTADRNYAIQRDSSGRAMVNVPWTNTAISLTTTGTGAASLSSGVLNIPTPPTITASQGLTKTTNNITLDIADPTTGWAILGGGAGTATSVIGGYAGDNATGNKNFGISTFISSSTVTTAQGNVAVGFASMGNSVTTANYNVVVGYEAGQLMTTADENVLIGKNAGETITTGTRNTIIGSGAIAGSGSVSLAAVAIGREASATTKSVAVGSGTTVAGATGTAVGNGAGTASNAPNGIALGQGAQATLQGTVGNVAIGSAVNPVSLEQPEEFSATFSYLNVTINGTQYYIRLYTPG